MLISCSSIPSISSEPTRPWQRWLAVVAGVLPFHLPLLQHLLAGAQATGFLQYDAPYYLANARAIFERGNGFAYPNAFDSDPQAPAIYFHWLIWLLGAGVKYFHFDPGALFASVGVVASLVCAALTLQLVEVVLPQARGRLFWFLLTLWGGGILCAGAIGANVLSGRAALENLLQLDEMKGWWFPNWGRNLILPTEAVYHSLAAAIWLGILKRRWWIAFAASVALAATHPFSGLQHLLILGAWVGLVGIRDGKGDDWIRLGLIAIVIGGFFAYYFWFLNLYPSHRTLVSAWKSGYPISISSIALAVGPLALVAGWRALRERQLDDAGWLWLPAVVITFLFMKHDWFISPHQPAHFSRGYLWMPIWLFALPQLQSWASRIWERWGRLPIIVLGGLFGCVIASDNVVFIALNLKENDLGRVYLSNEQREMFAWMDRTQLRGTLLSFDPRLSYYVATYTGVRPYVGHITNTPEIRTRWRNAMAWLRQGETGRWLDNIDFLLLDLADVPANLDFEQWSEVHRNTHYVLLRKLRVRGSAPERME